MTPSSSAATVYGNRGGGWLPPKPSALGEVYALVDLSEATPGAVGNLLQVVAWLAGPGATAALVLATPATLADWPTLHVWPLGARGVTEDAVRRVS